RVPNSASISSKKITTGCWALAFSRARSKTRRMERSVSPTYLFSSSGPLTFRNAECSRASETLTPRTSALRSTSSWATALAIMVVPQPGGPHSSTHWGGRSPQSRKRSCWRNASSTASRIASICSVSPPIWSKEISGTCSSTRSVISARSMRSSTSWALRSTSTWSPGWSTSSCSAPARRSTRTSSGATLTRTRVSARLSTTTTTLPASPGGTASTAAGAAPQAGAVGPALHPPHDAAGVAGRARLARGRRLVPSQLGSGLELVQVDLGGGRHAQSASVVQDVDRGALRAPQEGGIGVGRIGHPLQIALEVDDLGARGAQAGGQAVVVGGQLLEFGRHLRIGLHRQAPSPVTSAVASLPDVAQGALDLARRDRPLPE